MDERCWFDICWVFTSGMKTKQDSICHGRRGLRLRNQTKALRIFSSYYNFVLLKSISTYLHTHRGRPSDMRAYMLTLLGSEIQCLGRLVCTDGQAQVRRDIGS